MIFCRVHIETLIFANKIIKSSCILRSNTKQYPIWNRSLELNIKNNYAKEMIKAIEEFLLPVCLKYLAIFHHKTGVFNGLNILERIVFNSNYVCFKSNANRSPLFFNPEQFSSICR